MPPITPSTAARTELLERLDHFRVRPRVVLDLGGGVTADAQDALRRRFPAARILVTTPPVTGAPVADATLPGARSPGALRRAIGALRRLIPGATSTVERIEGTPDRLPLAAGSVDLALGHWFAPGIDALDAALAELRRVLAPGALFLWTTPGAGAADRTTPGADTTGTHPIDLHDLGSALARAGFLEPVLDVDRYGATGTAVRDGAVCEVIHAAAFAGEAHRPTRDATGAAGETVVPIGALRRRDRGTPDGTPP